MTQFSTNSDFSTDANGTLADADAPNAITGWTHVSPTGTAGSNSHFTVTTDAGSLGGKYVQGREQAWSTDVHFLQFDDPGTIAVSTDLDVLCNFSAPTLTAAAQAVGKFLISGSNYYAMQLTQSGGMQLYYYQSTSTWQNVGASDSTPDRAGTPAAIVAGTRYWMRIHKTAAGAWSWKCWSGLVTAEPAGWNLGDGGSGGTTETSVTSGLTGIGYLNTNAAIDYDWYSVGTGVDLAPSPGGADVDAPNLSLPTHTGITAVSVTLGATTDEDNGIAHAIITAAGNQSLPTNQEIIDGNAPEELFEAVDLTISAIGTFQFAAITGLTPSTNYGYAIVHEDDAGNEDAGSRVEGTFTALSAPTITFAAGEELHNGSIVVANETGMTAYCYRVSTGVLEHTETAYTSNATGLPASIVSPNLTVAVEYFIVIKNSLGAVTGLVRTKTAA